MILLQDVIPVPSHCFARGIKCWRMKSMLNITMLASCTSQTSTGRLTLKFSSPNMKVTCGICLTTFEWDGISTCVKCQNVFESDPATGHASFKRVERESVCSEADRIVATDRHASYGTPEESFGRIAKFWTLCLEKKLGPGVEVSSIDVANMMIAFKLSREIHKPGRDNRVDICGYSKCKDHLHDTKG